MSVPIVVVVVRPEPELSGGEKPDMATNWVQAIHAFSTNTPYSNKLSPT
jgi:hypothetical protein